MLCSGCGKREGTRKCSACLAVVYCSTDCQKLHWKNGHSKDCGLQTKKNIHMASFLGKGDQLKHILEVYPKISLDWANPIDGATAAYVAAQEGRAECLFMLSERGADLKKRTTNGYAPIHIACRLGMVDSLRVLLSKGISPVTPTSLDPSVAETPGQLCIIFGHIDCLALLYEYGVHPDTTNRHGQSDTHLASLYGVEKAIQLALKSGGTVNLRDHRNHTPMDLALARDHKSCVTLLRSLGGLSTPKSPGTKTVILSGYGNVLSSEQTTLVWMVLYLFLIITITMNTHKSS